MHLQRRDEQRTLSDGQICRIPDAACRIARHMPCCLARKVFQHSFPKSKLPGSFQHLFITNQFSELREVTVAGYCHCLLHVQSAVAGLAARRARERDPSDFRTPAAGEALRGIADIVLQCRRGDDQFENGARRVGCLQRPVEQTAIILAVRSKVIRNVLRLKGRIRSRCQELAAVRVADKDSGSVRFRRLALCAAEASQQRLTFLLHAQIQCGHDIALSDRRIARVCCTICVVCARICRAASRCFDLLRRDPEEQSACRIGFQYQFTSLRLQGLLAQKLQSGYAALLIFIQIADQMTGALAALIARAAAKRISTELLLQLPMNRRIENFCPIDLITRGPQGDPFRADLSKQRIELPARCRSFTGLLADDVVIAVFAAGQRTQIAVKDLSAVIDTDQRRFILRTRCRRKLRMAEDLDIKQARTQQQGQCAQKQRAADDALSILFHKKTPPGT